MLVKLDSLQVADWEYRSHVSHRAKLYLFYNSKGPEVKKPCIAQLLTIQRETV